MPDLNQLNRRPARPSLLTLPFWSEDASIHQQLRSQHSRGRRSRWPFLLCALLLALTPIVAIFSQSAITTGAVTPAMTGLNVSGNRIINGAGQPVRLLGVNKSGSEYACINGYAFFEGPTDDASIQAMKNWHINTVRVPLNEGCWLAINGAPTAYSGAAYQQAIREYVDRLTTHGLAVVLELHWSAAGTAKATGQQAMMNRDHSVEFWQQVATAYSGHSNVLFDLHNEPYPDNNRSSDEAWRCWRDGGTCRGMSFEAAGMQEVVNAVRAVGAQNVILLGGLQYANTLTRWAEFKPHDPLNNLAASWHTYNFNWHTNEAAWNTHVGVVVDAGYPLVAGEIGQNDCATWYIDQVMAWLDSRAQSYLGWTWNLWNCGSGPALITSYDGTPTAFGQGLKDHLALVTGAPTPGATATVVVPTPTPSAPTTSGPAKMEHVSRTLPTFASSGTPSAGNDTNYAANWRSSGAMPQWYGFNLSMLPTAKRERMLFLWSNYGTFNFDGVATKETGYNVAMDYTIQAHAGSGTSAPADGDAGWVTLATVTGEKYHSRQFDLALADYNWVRMRATDIHGSSGNMDFSADFDFWSAPAGALDSWIVYGDSIPAAGLRMAPVGGTNTVSQLIEARGDRFPAFEQGAWGGTNTGHGVQYLDKWLAAFPGKYVILAWGTNDANGQTKVADFKVRNLTMVDKILAAGKIPVMGTIPWARVAQIQTNAPLMNAKIKEIYQERPAVVRGPDLYTFFQANQHLISGDNLHPSAEGYAAYRQQWADAMLANVYGTTSPPPSTPPPAPTATPTTPTATPATPTATPATLSATPSPIDAFVLYDDALRGGFKDWSYTLTSRTTCDRNTYISGICSYAAAFGGWGGIKFQAPDGGLNTRPYDRLEWAVNTHGLELNNFAVVLVGANGKALGQRITLSQTYVTETLSGGWVRVALPLAQLNPTHAAVSSIQLHNTKNESLPTIHLDDIRFLIPSAR